MTTGIPGIQGLLVWKIIEISELLAGVLGQLVGVVLDLVPEIIYFKTSS